MGGQWWRNRARGMEVLCGAVTPQCCERTGHWGKGGAWTVGDIVRQMPEGLFEVECLLYPSEHGSVIVAQVNLVWPVTFLEALGRMPTLEALQLKDVLPLVPASQLLLHARLGRASLCSETATGLAFLRCGLAELKLSSTVYTGTPHCTPILWQHQYTIRTGSHYGLC